MNILLIIDDKFVPQAAACINSIYTSSCSDDANCLYIMSYGISEYNQRALASYANSLGLGLTIVDISGFTAQLGFDFNTSGWNEIVLARLLMARFLPKDLHRVLYLDADVIVRRSLDDLWTMNLNGHVLGMALEPTVSQERLRDLSLEGKGYYNAGVILVDLDAWRQSNAESRILNYLKMNDGRLFANDQDAINVALQDSIIPISPEYNASNIYTYYPFRLLHRLMPEFDDENAYNQAKDDPAIVHFLGEDRPWRKGNTHRYSVDYDNCLSETPWADTPKESGWELYFLCWRLFNRVFCHFPTLRYRIITYLIPVFLRYRSRRMARNDG